MKSHRRIATFSTLVLVAVVAWTASCSNKATNPGGSTPVAKELDSGNIANGGGYAHTFANLGTYNYHCTIHGTGMAGSVNVVAGAADSVLVTIGPGNTYNPTPATVKPTGGVRWINSGSTHTVTSN